MDFISNLANSVPGVGHVKGVYHYAKGEKKKGDEAMYQSTRSSAVIAGGILGGPPGAMAAGLATDAAASVVMDEEKGLVESCKNIGEDIAFNRNPARSIANAGLQLTLDGISGYGGGSSGGASKASARAVGKTLKRGAEQSIQKSVKISAAEIAKMGGRQSSKILAKKTAQRGLVIATNIGLTAARTELEERERDEERKRERRKRERKWRERERERELSEEERESEWEEELESESEEESESEWEVESESEWEEERQREREREWEENKEIEWRQHDAWKILMELKEQAEQWKQTEREYSGRELYLCEQYKTEQNNQSEQQQQQQKSKKQEENKNNKKEQRANSEKQTRNTPGSISASPLPPQPPQNNKDNNKKGEKNKEPTFFETFMALLRKILKIVYGNKSEPFSGIFQNLPKEQRKYLAKVLKPLQLMNSGTEAVIELVIRIFKQHFPQDISFLNFLCLLEFVYTYVTDELRVRTLILNGTETAEVEVTTKEQRNKIICEIASEKDIVEKLIELFDKLKIEIEAETAAWNKVLPNFRDIFAAVYHYFKHRRLPHDGRILSVKEYYDWIRKYLKELEQTQTLTELKKSKDQAYVREIFEPQFRRRFKIVLNIHGGNIVLSSALVTTAMHPDDKEKHVIVIVAEILALFTAIYLLFIFRNALFNALMLVLNIPLSICIGVFNCIYFLVKLLLNTLLFFFICLIFILKVILGMLLIFVLVWFLFFYLPDQR